MVAVLLKDRNICCFFECFGSTSAIFFVYVYLLQLFVKVNKCNWSHLRSTWMQRDCLVSEP